MHRLSIATLQKLNLNRSAGAVYNSLSFRGFCYTASQIENGDRYEKPQRIKKLRGEPMYGYAKKLELKNKQKEAGTEKERTSRLAERFKLKPEESLLAIDLVRKHKAMSRDVRKLRKFQKESPSKAHELSNFRPRPFPHCDPATTRANQAIIHLLRYKDESEEQPQVITKDQLVHVPEQEKESVGSLEDLELTYGTRPMRSNSNADAFRLPLSRPDTRAFLKIRPSTMDTFDTQFSEWFIGITEAQQAFHYDNTRPYFAIQHSDIDCFSKVRAKLHFGHVDRIKKIFYVKADQGIQWIIHILNGNLFLKSSRNAFRDWVERYKEVGVWEEGDKFEVKMSCQWQPQLNNKWLAGFIESNFGMFAGRIVEDAMFPYFRIRLKFWVISSDFSLLEHLQKMFDGGEIEEDGDMWRWTVKNRKDHMKVDKYCRMFSPLSKKNITICRYNRLLIYPVLRVKTKRSWTKLNRLTKSLNEFERQLALSIRCHPYHLRYKELTTQQMKMARSGASKKDVSDFKNDAEEKSLPFWEKPPAFRLVQQQD